MKDKTVAVLPRLVTIPFNAAFSKNDANYDPANNNMHPMSDSVFSKQINKRIDLKVINKRLMEGCLYLIPISDMKKNERKNLLVSSKQCDG